MKALSCGILVLNRRSELLLCRATGTLRWDIPKGGGDPGETPLQTALRETAEECGLRFAPDELLELGRFAYRPGKDLHLYAALRDGVDASACRCRSHFTDLWGRVRPEMDAFEWTAFERVPRRCARRMAALLTHTLSLPQLLLRLQRHAAPGEVYSRPRGEDSAMEPGTHSLRNLFEQLGLPSEQAEVERFVAKHRPLDAAIALADAAFWSAAQAQFLREEVEDDADWAEVVDQLNLMLRG